MKNKTINWATFAIVLVAIIERFMGLLPELGLDESDVKLVEIAGMLILAVIQAFRTKNVVIEETTIKTVHSKDGQDSGGTPIGGGGGTPVKP